MKNEISNIKFVFTKTSYLTFLPYLKKNKKAQAFKIFPTPFLSPQKTNEKDNCKIVTTLL